jgi:hypothetical protein
VAAYEVLLLNTAIPQIQAAQTGDTYVVPRAIAFNSGVNVVNNDVTIHGLTVGRGAGAVATNTAVGTSALAANTSGADNTAFGLNALAANTTGTNSTAVGYQAALNILANTNDAFGALALRGSATVANNTGTNNAAFGYQALVSNTSGSFNVALGQFSLLNNTTASNNTAVGYQALYSNTTAADLTAIGWQAGYSATGTGSTYLGSYSGNSTTGIYNTFVGHTAGYLVTSGTRNTIIGRYNGNQGGLDIRTLSNRIVLSDGDGNPRGVFDNNGKFTVDAGFITTAGGVSGGVSFTGSCNGDLGTIGLQIANTSNNVGAKAIRFLGWDGSETGSVTTNVNNTTYNTSSDYRLKNITGPITNSGSYIDSLKPVEGTWKHDGSVFVGLVAHEAQEVSRTQIATGSKDGDEMQGMSYSSPEMIANLIAEVQSLRARVAALESI